ncbi:hypothetical protein PsYK624_164670 [Phanerochaete sordida]|uniref:GTP-binding protein 2 n=1 Tax=Phanerochaete sordida TaxID=48140 RepID=A0A9P3GQX2_9APHY|nr:hypothetical protein PsYK624_164670 [Phanerochaete sordida]
MFGDDEECLRALSPWDGFMSSTPSEVGSLEAHKPLRNGIPKLAPEVEEGNVEYKLKLTDISPARFARLVTQLKWRLLEGGGQAYYELGVADSGALIGLSRADLETSLETLEMMAGEIGASVIVVKEIEVPSAMVAFADKVSAYIDPETGKWTEKMSNKRFRSGGRGGEATASGTETETEADTDTDDGPSLLSTPDYPPVRSAPLLTYDTRQSSSNPERPSSQSSPFIAPLDDDLALFSMEPEHEFEEEGTTDADKENDTTVLPADADIPDISLDIEISAVYKPRPFRRRTPHPPGAGVFGGKQGRKGAKPAKEKRVGWNMPVHLAPDTTDASRIPNPQEAKALLRRQARDKRREEKRKALLAGAGAATVLDGAAVAQDETLLPVPATAVDVAQLADDAADLTAGLAKLHVTVESADVIVEADPAEGVPPPPVLAKATPVGEPPTPALTDLSLPDSPPFDAKEPRLIVEALVVRKMSIDEGFLDFGGFSVI